MNRSTLALGLVVLAASGVGAQSAPNIMKPKQVAARAVAAANARTTASSTLPEESDSLLHEEGAGGSRVAMTDSAAGSTSVSAPKKEGAFDRETFAYARSGRRDPFVSLMNTSELRPLISDLKLVAIVFDAVRHNSVAVLRDLGTKEQYRIRTGQSLGRMRVASISAKAVVFTIEEFGYSRQETLGLSDSNQEKKQ